MMGEAKPTTSGSVVLTEARNSQTGIMFHPIPKSSDRLRVDFTFEIGGGSRADGIALLVMRSLPEESSLGGAGGTVGSEFTSGMAVEFDTYRNVWDHSDNHVSVNLLEGQDLDPLTAVDLDQDLRTGIFDAEVLLDAGRVRLYLSNAVQQMSRTLVLDFAIPEFVPFKGYIGLLGKTGGSTDRHVVHDARLYAAEP